MKKSYLNMIGFCDRKLTELHRKHLLEGSEVPGSSYLSKNNADFVKKTQLAKDLAESSFFLEQGNKNLSSASLSFGRSGSDKFKNMSDAFRNYQTVLKTYLQDKSPENEGKLYEQMRNLDKKAAEYLKFKNDQIRDKKIESTVVKGPDGKEHTVAAKSATRNRMDFAAGIRREIAKQQEHYFGTFEKTNTMQESKESAAITM